VGGLERNTRTCRTHNNKRISIAAEQKKPPAESWIQYMWSGSNFMWAGLSAVVWPASAARLRSLEHFFRKEAVSSLNNDDITDYMLTRKVLSRVVPILGTG